MIRSELVQHIAKEQPDLSLADIERHFILATLEHFGGDKRKAAEVLGISLKTIYNRLNNYSAAV